MLWFRTSSFENLQENVTNTFAAFSNLNDKGFASPQEFEKRAQVFKENILQLLELNTKRSDYIVSYAFCHYACCCNLHCFSPFLCSRCRWVACHCGWQRVH